jgi:hypothetical protein
MKRSWSTMREGEERRVQSKKGDPPPAPVAYTAEDGTVYPSRSAFKKHVKKQEMDKKRKERRVKEKEDKRAKREVDGAKSNLKLPPLSEAESADAARRREERDARIRQERLDKAATTFKVLIDLGFTELMTPKESLSMGSQITYCYAFNRRNFDSPVYLDISEMGGSIEEYLSHLAGKRDDRERLSIHRRSTFH